nr:hypothetical protein [Asanoa ferruginea]
MSPASVAPPIHFRRQNSLQDIVYVGLSAGSLVLTPRVGPEFADDRMPGLVDFSIFPHLTEGTWTLFPAP